MTLAEVVAGGYTTTTSMINLHRRCVAGVFTYGGLGEGLDRQQVRGLQYKPRRIERDLPVADDFRRENPLRRPESGDCVGQVLRLFHDSRSASEEFISGEVWFAGLHLERVASLTAAGK